MEAAVPNCKVSSNVGGTYKEWLRSSDTKLSLLRRIPHNMINHRVPSKIRAVKPEVYTPQMVSIGPYHRNAPELQAMEEVKWRYMLCFLDRVAETDTGNIEINESHGESSEKSPHQILALDKCYTIISELEIEVRAFYAENINLDKQQLVEMILVDACFILEFMRRLYVMKVKTPKDPASYVLLVGHMTRAIMHALTQDLMLLENQIPYNILQQLFDVIPSSKRICNASTGVVLSLQELALWFFCPLEILSFNNLSPEKPIQNATFSHLLDMLHRFCSHTSHKSPRERSESYGLKSCAAELIKSGFKISLHGPRMSIVDLDIDKGELFIPKLVMDKFTVTLLRNLIALEMTRKGRPVITSYFQLLSTLIRSREDVYLLERAGLIISSMRGSIIEDFFQNLFLEVETQDFVFTNLCKEVDKFRIPVWRWRRVKGYVSITWYRWKESIKDLKRDYFNNRWSLIAFLAASFVILLTLAQTLYTIRAYYPPYH